MSSSEETGSASTDLVIYSHADDGDLVAERHARNSCIGCLAVVIIMILAGYAWWGHSFEAGRYPHLIHMTRTIYDVERAWGIGPGANETGLVLKELSVQDAERLSALGPALSDDASIRGAVGMADRDYGTWRRTPVDTADTDDWGQASGGSRQPSINNYLDRHGFDIKTDRTVTKQVDRILSNPGSYYAYGPGGSMIVIAPIEKRVIFAYAG